MRCADRPPSR